MTAISLLIVLGLILVFDGTRRRLKALCARPARWLRDPIQMGTAALSRTVLISGGTGFIGYRLGRQLVEQGDRLIVLTRNRPRALDLYGPHARIVTDLADIASSERIDAIVNLAGERILARRWTQSRRRQLLDSRVSVTRALVDLLARLATKPEVFISMSAIGYYGVRGEQLISEADRGQPSFQSQLCQVWESCAQIAASLGVRTCILRAGLVLGTDDGALPPLATAARFGLSSVLGTGKQWLSWIHIDDLLRLFELCMKNRQLAGALNATAPRPVRQRRFAMMLAATFRTKVRLNLPSWCLRSTLGEMSELLVDGQRVLPLRVKTFGFQFRHATLKAALSDLFSRTTDRSAMQDVVYDAECPICEMEMSRYSACATQQGLPLRFQGVADSAELLRRYRIDVDAGRKRVYLRDGNGRMISGIDALLVVWSELPHWRWFATLLAAPGLRWVAALCYDLIVAPLVWRFGRWHRGRYRVAAHE